MNELQNLYGVPLSYKKACRLKESTMKSVIGLDEESYVMLPSFTYILENYNSGSIVSLEMKKYDQLFCIFFCLATFIQSWPHCRLVLIVDETFLKAK